MPSDRFGDSLLQSSHRFGERQPLEARTPTFFRFNSPAFSFGRLPFSEAPQAPAMALNLFLGADHDMRAPIGRLARSMADWLSTSTDLNDA
jgi:hypothetical protein